MRSDQLQTKISYLRNTPLRELKGNDFWFPNTYPKDFGETQDSDYCDPFAYDPQQPGAKTPLPRGVADGEEVPRNPVHAIQRIRWWQRTLLGGCVGMALPLWVFPSNVWNWLPLVAVFSALAWWVSDWLEDKADAAYDRAVTTSLVNARLSSEAWVRTRWLGAAFELINNSPVLVRRFNVMEGVTDESDPNGFDHILSWLRESGVLALENFSSRHVKGSSKDANLLAAEGRYDRLIKQAESKNGALKHRWLWGLNNYKQLISLIAVLSGIPGLVIVLLEASRLFTQAGK
jgi:hypothetical protein